MKQNNLQSIKIRIADLLTDHKINQALAELDSMAALAHAPWQMTDTITKLKDHYSLMCRYALDGVIDDNRNQVLEDIVSSIGATADAIIRSADMNTSPMLYFSALRYESMQTDSSINDVVALYREKTARYNMGVLAGNPDIKEADGTLLVKSLEALAMRFFNLVWVRYPFEVADEEVLLSLMEDPTLPFYIKKLVLSAVMLGALNYYDERRLLLLGKIYQKGLEQLDIRALCAMLLVMWVHRRYINTRKMTMMIESLEELPNWENDVKMAFLQLVRTRDTERITRTMREDVIPSMMKLKPEINKLIKDKNEVFDPSMMDANPEWEELFEKSGLNDKLREISEMQAEGADVMMSTFSHLKTFPFFNEVGHWFLPFYAEYSSNKEILGDKSDDMVAMLDMNPMLCDSDKYSMIFSLEHVGASARQMMTEQLKAQGINMAELRSSALLANKIDRENIANKYVHDLYRFFTLFRRKNEFDNPFLSPINLVELPLLNKVFDDGHILELVAQFYFKRGYYSEAYSLFKLLLQRKPSDAQLYQKAGYCLQQTGDITGAIRCYERSELINSEHLWTIRRLADCYRMVGNSNKALAYYSRLATLKPDDLSIAYQLGNCLLDSGNYNEALKQYFKVEFKDASNTKVLRPIAWCLFLTEQDDRSAGYYEKIMSDEPNANDHLNYGHLLMASKKYRDALKQYQYSFELSGRDFKKWTGLYNSDRGVLISRGVDPFMIDIAGDEILNA